MIEYAVLGRFLGQFEALLDNVIDTTSGETTQITCHSRVEQEGRG